MCACMYLCMLAYVFIHGLVCDHNGLLCNAFVCVDVVVTAAAAAAANCNVDKKSGSSGSACLKLICAEHTLRKGIPNILQNDFHA